MSKTPTQRYHDDPLYERAVDDAIDFLCSDACKGGTRCGEEAWQDCPGFLEEVERSLREGDYD
jgi:hypothetical protein